MSDTKSFFDEEVGNYQELIAVVRVNRFLYDKTEKLYANVAVKIEAWTQIGASLTHPLEGPVAEKTFFTLRQRFGKERRKVIQTVPRSGAGADQPIYTPTWVLYKDLTFLEDIIKPRKTFSNYKSKAPANIQVPVFRTSSPFFSTSAPGVQVTVLRTISPISSTSAVTSSNISSCTNADFITTLADTDESYTDISDGPLSPPPITPRPATPPPATLPPAVVSGSGSNNAIAQVQRAMSNIGTKRKVPPPDFFATKKRKEGDGINKSLIEQTKRLTDLAAKIGQAIMAPPPPPSAPSAVVSASPGTQSMLSAIGFALGTVPEHTQLKCLIGILQFINDFSSNIKNGQQAQ